MKTSELIFIGIKGAIIALNRATGEQVWVTHLKGSDFVNIALLDGILVASCYGEIFCLDPLTGNGLWHNRLKGFGTGLATITAEDSLHSGIPPVMAEKHRRDQQAAAASTAAAAT